MIRVQIPDVHCHLDAIQEPERAIEEALEAGVRPILAVGMVQTSNEKALGFARRYAGDVFAAVGLHPSEIPALSELELQRELDFVHAQLPEADALGEVGLDYRDATDEFQQRRQHDALEQQLAWAEALRKPVSAHCRRAEHDLVEIASDFVKRTGLGMNLHWFTHSQKLAKRCGESGVYISPGPAILESEPQAEVSRLIASRFLLLETDSPVEFAGERARPLWAIRVAERLAALRGDSLADLASLLQRNFKRYLGGD